MLSSKVFINLKPVEMSEEIMDMLEKKNLIMRITPNNHKSYPEKGNSLVETLYKSDITYGSHKIITVNTNNSKFVNFSSHPDNEEFLLIGEPNSRPLYLCISYLSREELQKNINDKSLKSDDFILLKCKYNNPYLSFFTMLKNIPHGEATDYNDGEMPRFYVTEPTDLPLDLINFKNYELIIAAND